ncbi:DUF411 domain-containing protein [Scytonema sp. NUACC21]
MHKRLSSWIRNWVRPILISIITGFAVMSCATAAVAGEGNTASFSGTQEITVYRSPYCSCCGGWVEHMQKHGFKIKDIKTDEIEAIKQKYNLPPQLASCHTAIVDGYVMEGHIPADNIKRLLKQKPNVAGLAVPGMPVGTPGMEMGSKKQPFAVMAFDSNGDVTVFQEYRSY